MADRVLDAIAERADDDRRVVGKARRGVALGPTAGVLQGLRQVPVVERRERPNAGGERRIDQPFVVVEPLRVGRAAAVRLDPRPGDRKTVALQSELLQQRDVVGVAVVAVAGNVAGVAVRDAAGRV